MRICSSSVGLGAVIAAVILASGASAATTTPGSGAAAAIAVARPCYVNTSRTKRAPMTVTLEHHDGIDAGDEVQVEAAFTTAGFDLWVRSPHGLAAAVRVSAA